MHEPRAKVVAMNLNSRKLSESIALSTFAARLRWTAISYQPSTIRYQLSLTGAVRE
jgi:hypothetical protein